MKKMEEWRDIEEYKGFYQVSNLGRVRSLNRTTPSGAFYKGRVLKLRTSENYLMVNMRVRWLKKNLIITVHRLVAKAFIPNPHNKKCVNHKDGNMKNNESDNLEWSTYQENSQHAVKNGLWHAAKGEKSGPSKLKNEQVIEIRRLCLETDLTMTAIGKMFDTSRRNIGFIKTNKTWKHLLPSQGA